MTEKKLSSPFDDEQFLALFGYLEPMEAVAGIDHNTELVDKLKTLFGEAGHVFEWHAEGNWAGVSGDKDRLALELAAILKTYPGLGHRLLKTNNRIVKMITYRALELMKTLSAPASNRT